MGWSVGNDSLVNIHIHTSKISPIFTGARQLLYSILTDQSERSRSRLAYFDKFLSSFHM